MRLPRALQGAQGRQCVHLLHCSWPSVCEGRLLTRLPSSVDRPASAVRPAARLFPLRARTGPSADRLLSSSTGPVPRPLRTVGAFSLRPRHGSYLHPPDATWPVATPLPCSFFSECTSSTIMLIAAGRAASLRPCEASPAPLLSGEVRSQQAVARRNARRAECTHGHIQRRRPATDVPTVWSQAAFRGPAAAFSSLPDSALDGSTSAGTSRQAPEARVGTHLCRISLSGSPQFLRGVPSEMVQLAPVEQIVCWRSDAEDKPACAPAGRQTSAEL
jgi:hypothetical protein